MNIINKKCHFLYSFRFWIGVYDQSALLETAHFLSWKMLGVMEEK